MRSIESIGNVTDLRGLFGDATVIATKLVIDGSGDPTLSYSAKGLLSVARSTNTYTITCKFTAGLSIYENIMNPVAATINCPLTVTLATTGMTIAAAFSAGVTSITCPIMVIVAGDAKA